MNDQDFLRQLHEAFAIEAEEHLQAMTSKLLELEKAAAPDRKKEIVEVIFREAHSLKGAAHAVGRTDVESVCQALESVFAEWKRRGAREATEAFDVLGSALDFSRKLLAQPGVSTEAPSQAARQEIVRRVTQLISPIKESPASHPEESPALAAPEPAAAPSGPAKWSSPMPDFPEQPCDRAGANDRVTPGRPLRSRTLVRSADP